MSSRAEETEPTVSVEVRLLVDRLCDDAERMLITGESVDWDQLFGQVNSESWPYLIKCLAPQLEQVLGLRSREQLRELFGGAAPQIQDLVSDFLEHTIAQQTLSPATLSPATMFSPRHAAEVDPPIPDEIDHFRIIKQVGRGGFGRVLLAHDRHLNRDVVIKLPRERDVPSKEYLASFVEEARKIALLEHPGIVRIHHVGVWNSHPYLVQQYVIGGDLKHALRSRKFSFRETAELIAEVAETIAFAHRLRIVHRDLKPANILLNEYGRPLVADFGLAIHESEQIGKGGIVAGTAQYMAPEQLRGEVHRLDGRTDLWSLGVCMFLMLTGEMPFQGEDSASLKKQVNQQPCRPPRQLNAAIPWELERICLKCLSKRMEDRYGTGVDLADELKEWMTRQSRSDGSPSPSGAGVHVAEMPLAESVDTMDLQPDRQALLDRPLVPKGLIAFDHKDHQNYLNLVPGPRDKFGIPSQLRFWVDKIVTDDPGDAFCVGLIYGPSGCGKSSFVKAGLLPLLSQEVAVVYVEATDTDTEVRLLVGLRKHFPDIPRDMDLPGILSNLRRRRWIGPYRKILIVFDQFEQWLHVNEVTLATQLVEAMRHCDGVTLQSLVLARDDFWMKVSRFFQELEIPLEERRNYQPLHLFDLEHAKRVLSDYGRAYGRLPNSDSGETEQQGELHRKFVTEAVERLADNGKIICIHLVLFTETFKDQDWIPASLRGIGNLNQIGVLFLEQQFSSETANPSHRLLRDGVCRALEYLLPVDDANIKARFRERQQIAKASGFPAESKQFLAMMNVLEKQLRLIFCGGSRSRRAPR